MALPRARPAVARMSGYVPGEQPAPGERVIKLNTNENPFPPSPRVLEAIRAVDGERLRRYPPPGADAFRAVAAGALGVSPDMILCGNGSDEILSIVVRTFLGPGDTLAVPEPTYSLYPVLAEVGEARFVPVPWQGDWDLPVDLLCATGAAAVFFANPNAPSGTVVPTARIRDFARRFGRLVVVDEAYVDFADDNALPLLRECDNVLVSRSLSKGYALAGLRFGFVVGSPALLGEMRKVKDSYNVDALALAAATAALEDQEWARRSWQHVRAERTRLSAELVRRGFVVVPSQANFLLATVPGGDGGAVYRQLKERGILVRHFDKPGLGDKIRITIGTRQDDDALLAALG